MRTQEELDELRPAFDHSWGTVEKALTAAPQRIEWAPATLLLLAACSSRNTDVGDLGSFGWPESSDDVNVLHLASHGEGSLGSLLTVPPHGAPGSDAKIAALEERIRNLEVLLAQLLAEREQRRSKENAEPSEDQDEEVVVQAHHKWIEANRDTLREYIDSFVALDPDLGIVAHAPDGDELEAQLDSLSDEERSRVVVFHASMYFR